MLTFNKRSMVAPFWLGVTHERGSLLWVLNGDRFFELVTESDSPEQNLAAVVLSCWLRETQRRVVLVVKEWLGVGSLYSSELEEVSWGLPSQFDSLFTSIVITDEKKYGLLDPMAFFEQLSQNSNLTLK